MVESAPLAVERGDAASLARSAAMRAWPLVERVEAAFFGDRGPSKPPLFVVGLPRAGTTLVYQSLCHSLQVSYIPELARYAPVAPAFAAWTARAVSPRYRSAFTSHYGSSPGLTSPGESTTWNLWFDRDRFYDACSDLPARSLRAIRGMVGRVERIGGGPFVNKNLRNNSRVRLLAELFPSAVFLIVVRDPLAVATSLLTGRVEQAGGADAWFSIKPRDYADFRDATPAVQVARQLAGLLRDLGDDLSTVGAERFAVVGYEDFCRHPRRFLDDLATCLGPAAPHFRRVADPPESYGIRPAKPPAVDEATMRELGDVLPRVCPADLVAALPAAWLAR